MSIPSAALASFPPQQSPITHTRHRPPDGNSQSWGHRGCAVGGPSMRIFVRAYYETPHDPANPPGVMNCFDPARIPVLTDLAKRYAVCDRWFSSVPGPTLPNRSYI